MKNLAIAAFLGFVSAGTPLAAQEAAETRAENVQDEKNTAEEAALSPEEQKYLEWARGIWDSLNRQKGKINLAKAGVTLNVPESFYYLDPADTEKVLVEVWGNMPGAGKETLGMLFPSGSTPFDENSWGVTIEYVEEGYVSDEDADEINYNELLADMKKDTREESKQRVSQGYEPIELVGWASKPFYDKVSHKLHWAKELKFADEPVHTLNYNIRVLGRKGVLVLNFIAGMEQKELIDSRLDSVLAMANFDQGSTYGDFNPSIDKVAAYGLGALVAGKILAKTGLLAAGLLLLKKFGVAIFLGLAALFAKIFRRKPA